MGRRERWRGEGKGLVGRIEEGKEEEGESEGCKEGLFLL